MKQDHHKNILTRGLPKTEQDICYRAGDDGDNTPGLGQVGWWLRRIMSNNRQRFIPRTINGDDIVVDRATGLMWAADGAAAGGNFANWLTWNNAIDYALGLTFASFSDWRLPNIKELVSLICFDRWNTVFDPTYFTGIVNDYYWSSTTRGALTFYAWQLNQLEGQTIYAHKTEGEGYILCVRCI